MQKLALFPPCKLNTKILLNYYFFFVSVTYLPHPRLFVMDKITLQTCIKKILNNRIPIKKIYQDNHNIFSKKTFKRPLPLIFQKPIRKKYQHDHDIYIFFSKLHSKSTSKLR